MSQTFGQTNNEYKSLMLCKFVCCQTFNTSSFGDEDVDISAGVSAEKQTHSEVLSAEVIDVDDLQFADSPAVDDDEENVATLFMSCSPGRDTEEEEEDEDDSVPLSKVYGVNRL